MHIQVKRGKDIPIKGKPSGEVRQLPPPKLIALDVSQFEEIKFKVLAKVGDPVKVGQPLLHDKRDETRMFVAPAGGVVKEIRRGLKRRLLSVVIERDTDEQHAERQPLNLAQTSRDELISFMCDTGLFAHIRMRPFNLLARPGRLPRSIFVKACETAPFVAPAHMQIKGHESAFQTGLDALAKLTDGKVHLVSRPDSAFAGFKNVELHTVDGPHPASSPSVHIHHIDPITKPTDVVWTVNAHDVVVIGTMIESGKYHNERVIGVGGKGVLPEERGFFRVRTGCPLEYLLADRADRGELRMISGDPLHGEKGEMEDFLGFSHFAFSVIPEPKKREFLHFFRPGFGKYTATRTYATGHISSDREYDFTTSQHGEERAFIDGAIYDKFMPMRIPTALLVKAVIADDYEKAEELGILEVSADDFALPTFVCPSKVEMVDIIHKALHTYAPEVLPASD